MRKETQVPKKPEGTHPNAAAFPKGVSGPALRALQHAGIRSLTDIAKWTEEDLGALHGMGPRAITAFKAALKAQGKKFRSR
jgi:predicted flap endonuclease-1-like 5' DNA nuclease